MHGRLCSATKMTEKGPRLRSAPGKREGGPGMSLHTCLTCLGCLASCRAGLPWTKCTLILWSSCENRNE